MPAVFGPTLHKQLAIECVKRQRETLNEITTEVTRIAEQDKRRQVELFDEIKRWKQAKAIREYVAAVRENLIAGVCLPSREMPSDQWIKWMEWSADCLDPLTPAPGPFVVRQPPKDTAISELEITDDARSALESMQIRSTSALSRVSKSDVLAFDDRHGRLWNEVVRVLAIQGFEVDKDDVKNAMSSYFEIL